MGKKKPKVRWTAVEENFFCSTSCSGDDEDSNVSGNGVGADHAHHNGNGEASLGNGGEGALNGGASTAAAHGGSYNSNGGGKYGNGGRRFHGGRREEPDSIRPQSFSKCSKSSSGIHCIVKDEVIDWMTVQILTF